LTTITKTISNVVVTMPASAHVGMPAWTTPGSTTVVSRTASKTGG